MSRNRGKIPSAMELVKGWWWVAIGALATFSSFIFGGTAYLFGRWMLLVMFVVMVITTILYIIGHLLGWPGLDPE